MALVIVNVLLDRVVFGEHIEDFSFRCALLYAVSITLLLHVHDLVALYVEHVLASLQGRLQLSLLLSSLPQLPLGLVDQVLLQPDGIEFGVELASICLECVGPRAVISKNLSLLKRFILLLFKFYAGDFLRLLCILNCYLLAGGWRRFVIFPRLSFGSFGTDSRAAGLRRGGLGGFRRRRCWSHHIVL